MTDLAVFILTTIVAVLLLLIILLGASSFMTNYIMEKHLSEYHSEEEADKCTQITYTIRNSPETIPLLDE